MKIWTLIMNQLTKQKLQRMRNLRNSDQQEQAIKQILRLVAYKKFTGMVYSILGHSHRVPIPSCAVNKIRESFLDPLGRYTGFKWLISGTPEASPQPMVHVPSIPDW
ncbi:uncharacterized protein ACNLHF_014293 [Anomaloglossus baeobatrachus]